MVRHLPALVIGTYFVIVAAVTLVEALSEFSKLSRGMFTNTFSPFFWAEVLTLPTSLFRAEDRPGYPETFNEATWRHVVVASVPNVLLSVLINSVLVFVAVWLARRVFTSIRSRP